MEIQKGFGVSGEEAAELFRALEWSSAKYPDRLDEALKGSHGVWTLRDGARLAGLVTAVSDGAMCVYFPYVAVHPDYQGQGWGRRLMEEALSSYSGFHHVALIAYADKTGFYEKTGFVNESDKASLFYRAR